MRRELYFARCFVDLTDLLQTRAQVAAQHKANSVYLHAMDAGLRVTFLHPLQVGFLLEERSGHCQE